MSPQRARLSLPTLSAALAVAHCSPGPPRRRLPSVLYLAKSVVAWVASVLSLEQRKCCNTCQELNFIFKSCFLQNWVSVASPVRADPHVVVGVGWGDLSSRW